MATDSIIQPLLNPVKFIHASPAIVPQYLSRHMDDFFYLETIKPWQQRREFVQPWQTSDSIRFQLQSKLAPIKYTVIDHHGRPFITGNMQDLQQNVDDPDWRIYQADIALATLNVGLYFIQLQFGSVQVDGNFPLTLISEPLHVAQAQRETLYLDYKHHQYYGDVIFETGFAPSIRLRATLRLKDLSSKDTFFEDQVLDMQMLDSKPFRIFQLQIGGASGVPDYLADIVNRLLGCSTVLIDGKPYAKADGAKMEESALSNYPMRGWSIDLREAVNRSSNIYESNYQTQNRITVIATVDGKGFSQSDVGGSEEQVQEFL